MARLPDGHPEPIGRLTRLALAGDADGGRRRAARRRASSAGRRRSTPQAVLDYLLPMLEPIAVDEFQFTRAWLRAEAARIASPKSPGYQLGRQLNLPPSYLLIHRVTLGSIGVLCQLEAKAPYRAILQRWLPGFAPGGLATAAAPPPWEPRQPGGRRPALRPSA